MCIYKIDKTVLSVFLFLGLTLLQFRHIQVKYLNILENITENLVGPTCRGSVLSPIPIPSGYRADNRETHRLGTSLNSHR